MRVGSKLVRGWGAALILAVVGSPVWAQVPAAAPKAAYPGAVPASVPAPKPVSYASIDARLEAMQADPQLFRASVHRGAKVAAFCANCHGPSGNSAMGEVPNLAGQNAGYLMEQMKKFTDGRRRDPFMNGMIKAMTEQERVDAVLYYIDQPVTPQAADNPALVARGKYVYEHNCFRCHGAQGLGNTLFPRLAGQQKVYLTRSLRRYRDGTGERLDPLMADSTRLMTDDDITAVTAYVASLK